MTARHETATVGAPISGDLARACPGVPPGGYIEERRGETLGRLRRAALFALVPIAAGAGVNVLTFSDRLPERLATFATEATLCLAALAAARRPWAERKAIPLAVSFVMTMGAALLWALSLSPRDLDVLVGIVPATMIAATLLFPWGVGPQVIVSTFLALGYLLLPPGSSLDHARIVNMLITLTHGIALSVVGAFMLDRYRHEVFTRSVLQREEAEVSAALLHVAQSLSAHLGRADTLDQITRLTVEVLGCDWSSIYMWDARRQAFLLRANTGARPEVRGEVEQIEFTEASFPIVRAARPGEVLELPDCSNQALIPPALMERWEIASMLGVLIARRDETVGSLLAGYRQRTGQFSAKQRRLVRGIAHAAAVAVENARLIADLEAASRLKSEFVSTMSHELRSPLNVILGFAEMARDPAIAPSERGECIARVEAAGRELLTLIESTLEVSRLEAGREELRLEEVPLREFWAGLRDRCASLPRGPGVVLHWGGDVPDLALRTDPRKLTIVIRNLVGNALKFTERGSVWADVRLGGDSVVLRVADTGIGIRPEDQETIFEMFRQADGSDSRRFGGTGLGLYIVRRFVQQLGGTIGLESAPGQGSVFTVALPRCIGAELPGERTAGSSRPLRSMSAAAGA